MSEGLKDFLAWAIGWGVLFILYVAFFEQTSAVVAFAIVAAWGALAIAFIGLVIYVVLKLFFPD